MPLNFEIPKILKELKKRKPKKILLQLPEGIKQNAFEIVKEIEKLGIEVVVSGDTAWGACCVDASEAKSVGVDLILHLGHTKFHEPKFPTIFVEVKDELNLEKLLKKSLVKIKQFKKIGLSVAVQHIHDLKKIKSFYEQNEKKVFLSKKKGLIAYEGHVVGCQFEGLKSIQNDVEAFIIVGNNFHSMGAAISVEKPVFLIDVYNDDVREMKDVREKIIKQRFISIDKCKAAKRVAIIVEAKSGQKFGTPKTLSKKLKGAGKEVIIVRMNEMTQEKLMNFYNVDCFISLACPRIAVDDFFKYEKPIITYREALVAIGEKTFDDLMKEGFI